jgi:hypothetical protein
MASKVRAQAHSMRTNEAQTAYNVGLSSRAEAVGMPTSKQ